MGLLSWGSTDRSDVETEARRDLEVEASMGHATSFATFRIDLIPRLMRPRQSRAESSEPSQIPGRISMGPSAYGTDGDSSSRCRKKAAGSETTDGRLRGSKAGEGGTGGWSWVATARELEDGLVWRVRESRFTFRTDRGLVGERSNTDSDSEEGPDGGGLSPSATRTVDRLAGGGVIFIPRLAGMIFLRGRVVDCCVVVDCMIKPREGKGMTTCVLFKEKKKEDIRQRGRRGRRATDAQTDEGQMEGEGVGVESVPAT